MYWLFVINNNYWNEFLKTDKKNICCQTKNGIKKNDKIILYVKGKKSGFIGYSECLSDEENENEDIEIFSSKKDNKYIIKIDDIKYFDICINLKTFFLNVENNIIEQEGLFKYKYIRGNIIYKQFNDNVGSYIITTLVKINKDNISNNKNSIKKKTKINNSKKKNKKNNNKSVKIIKSEDIGGKGYPNDKQDIFVKIANNKLDKKIINTRLYIPIMVIPKVHICLPEDTNKINIFFDLYNKYDTEIINNNNCEISWLLNSSLVEFKEINSATSEKNTTKYYKEALECYHKCEEYKLPEYKNIPFIRIICINNIQDDYFGCYLLTWITNDYICEYDNSSSSSNIS